MKGSCAAPCTTPRVYLYQESGQLHAICQKNKQKIFFLLFKLIKLKCEIYVLYEFNIMVKYYLQLKHHLNV